MAATGTGAAMGIAGCTGGDDEDENVLVLSGDSDLSEIEDELEAALHDAGWSEEYELEVRAGDFETDSRRDDYQAGLDSNRGTPDLFMMDSGWTIPFIMREQLLNVEEELPDDIVDLVRDEYLDSAVDTVSHPETGDLYGIPFFPDYPVMVYRKDLVEEAGYDPEGDDWATDPMSWQEFSETVADVWDHHGGEDEYTYGFITQADSYEGLACCTFNETITSFGGAYFGGRDNLFGPIGDRPITVEEEPVLETIRMMRAFMYGDEDEEAHPDYPQITNDDITVYNEEDSVEALTADNAIFQRNWPYSIVEAHDNFDDDQIGVMPLPYGVEEGETEYEGTGGTQAALGGWHLTVNPYSDKNDMAIEALEAFTEPNVMLTVFELNGNLPPRPSVIEDADADEVGPVGNYLDTLSIAGENTIARPVTEIWPQQASLIYQEVNDAYRQEKTPAEAMETLAEQLEDSEQA
ncbi:ABC transporter substrate-binding protein [Halorubrum gandharaense]